MLVPALLIGLVIALLAAKVAPRLSVAAQVMGVLIVGYVLGYDFWHADAGPIPLTLDRLALVGVVGLSFWRLRTGETKTTTPIGLDWSIALLCGWLAVSCVLNKPGEGVNLPTSPLFRLVVSFWAPAVLYAVLRTSVIDTGAARVVLTALACLGVYLGVTALLETAGAWSLIFPRFIANPDLGLHFGRARGPALNSVSLGVHLVVCTAAAWLLIPRASRPMQLFWFGACAVMTLGVLLTYTRSTWLGLMAAVVVVMCLQLPKVWRLPSFATATVLGVLLLVVGKDAIVALKREDSGAVSAHSVQQREAFAYVSAQMVRDAPLWGVGFGRFYDKKMPYLTDRRQSFELESIRPLHHHNTFLGLLVETGMLGLAAFLAVLAGFGWIGWRLAHDPTVSADCNRLGLLCIAAVVNYLPSALFHDLTLVHSEEWLLFAVAGAAAGCWLNADRSAVQLEETSPLPFPSPADASQSIAAAVA
ncbi:O-Antigen ligase [Botrimarina colliarenosi]|uniref:O-Antigen ligase n=1 Tax=Botrimarina colliarenosi TaxID=2528001 RepID=A0A5C6A4U8_9BACT|nr:O-antigen ligase family protein [Botrimarina colliarenosi]TWT94081.1 O-Antigen ligase [Botrimarina colliarenosi]